MIRRMTIQDISHVQQIAHETWKTTYEGILPEHLQTSFLNRAYSNEMMLKRMEKTCILIAECEGVPIGYANFTLADEDGDSELTALYILPSHQQTGYGGKLLQTALSLLPDAQQLFVYVDGRNQIGRSFYEKQGFQLLEVFDEEFEGHPVETAQYVLVIENSVFV